MRKLLCFFGLHDPQVVRAMFWGNVYRTEWICVCGKRFEGFIAGSIARVYPAQEPGEFWRAYDQGKLPKL